MLSIYSDGSAHERAGLPGGWAFAVVVGDEVLLTMHGAQRRTTNNAMELEAALAGLRAVHARGWHAGHAVELVCDSRVVIDCASGLDVPARHAALAGELRAAALAVGAGLRWVRGHSGNRWNEYVDALAHDAKQALVPERVKARAARRRALGLRHG